MLAINHRPIENANVQLDALERIIWGCKFSGYGLAAAETGDSHRHPSGLLGHVGWVEPAPKTFGRHGRGRVDALGFDGGSGVGLYDAFLA